MSAMITGMTTIDWSVTTPDGGDIRGRITIDRDRADRLYAGRPPMSFDPFSSYEWQRRSEIAGKLAEAIASQIAADIIKACDPDIRREIQNRSRSSAAG